MVRQGSIDTDETCGMYDGDWQKLRNSSIQVRLQLIKQMIHDPFSKEPEYNVLYHPESGQCIQVGEGHVYGSYCKKSSRWSYSGDGNGKGSPIRLMGTSYCLSAIGERLPARLSNDCTSEKSLWKPVSGSSLHMAAKDGRGKPCVWSGTLPPLHFTPSSVFVWMMILKTFQSVVKTHKNSGSSLSRLI